MKNIFKTIKFKNQRGYIALMSAIVISALLIILVYILSFTSMFARFNILDAEYKKISLGLAEACVNVAGLKIAEDKDYHINGTFPETVNVGDKFCTITSVSLSGGKYTITTQGFYQNSYTDLEIEATRGPSNITIDSWQEIP